jgi:hypothetical protein
MKKILIPALVVTAMAGCASQQPKTVTAPTQSQPTLAQFNPPYLAPENGVYKLQGYKGPEAMDNQEVIQASKDCIYNKMRPNVTYLMVRTDQGKTRVPVSVSCEPY